jgi:outer membrane receptor for ferrienterochelin and colicins
MKLLRPLTGSLFVLLFVFGLTPEALSQHAVISGRVIDGSTNQPLPGANVVLTAPGSERVLGGATNADGTYAVPNIEPGTYVVSARFIGYSGVEHTITLGAGERRTLDFALNPGGFDLSTVVVTASRQQEKVLDAPASISVLGVREIESDVAANTSDVLRNTVGVDMAQTGVNRREIVLRGFNNAFSGQAYVLTDNRKAAVPSLGVNVHSIMPNMGIDTERIEVVRGPGSALYGPGVDAGVIHFISKDPFTYPGRRLPSAAANAPSSEASSAMRAQSTTDSATRSRDRIHVRMTGSSIRLIRTTNRS